MLIVLGTILVALVVLFFVVIIFMPKYVFQKDVLVLKGGEPPVVEDFEECMYHE